MPQNTMGKKIWLSMHPRNFGPDKIVYLYVRPFLLAEVKCLAQKTLHQKVSYQESFAFCLG